MKCAALRAVASVWCCGGAAIEAEEASHVRWTLSNSSQAIVALHGVVGSDMQRSRLFTSKTVGWLGCHKLVPLRCE